MKYQNVVRAFLASPGDAASEREALTKVVEELNLTWADFVGTRIDLIKWESHAVPSAGPDPQAAINDQLLGHDQYEIFIGILKRRLGTPTPRAASGTVEEFERAYDRYSSTGLPEIMFYLQAEVGSEMETANFKKRLKDLGVYYWSYRSDRQFEQACRIHLSRQIQRVARGEFTRQEQDPAFPNPKDLNLSNAVQMVNPLLDKGVISIERYVERSNRLRELTRDIGDDVERTQGKLNRLGRPGFRQPKGGRSKIIDDLAKKLDKYADSIERLLQELMVPYATGLDAYSRALAIIAPVAPLPQLLRSSVELSSQAIGFVGRSLSELRSSATKARDALAEWKRLDVDTLNHATRRTLKALDALDHELTSEVHLARAVETLAEDFLED